VALWRCGAVALWRCGAVALWRWSIPTCFVTVANMGVVLGSSSLKQPMPCSLFREKLSLRGAS